jgi:hypothetical protein|tara:strand:+ start:324 stop:626 length:303 start_codon:yes stop_codon:yes gene_type:complete
MIYNLSDALISLYPNEKYAISNNDYSTLVWSSDLSKPTLQELENKRDQMQAEYEANQYQRDRIYPNLSDQLDMIFWDKINGTEIWKETIEGIKEAHPKPE